MEIKRIQLRGISRSPSDRMTDDGGIAESLNAYLDHQEVAPAIVPKDISTELGIPEGNKFDYTFIHKTQTIENLIVVYTKDERQRVAICEDQEISDILTLDQDELVKNVTSFGNTIGVTTNQYTHWLLYESGDYSVLGTNVPFPKFHFANYEVAGKALGDTNEDVKVIRSFRVHESSNNNPAEVRKLDFASLQQSYDKGTAIDDEKSLSLINDVWEKFAEAEAINREEGVFNHQIHAILAIRLIDNSELISTPIVLSAGFNQPLEVEYKDFYSEYYEAGGDGENSYQKDEKTYLTSLDCKLKTAFKIFLQIDEDNNFFERWEKVIQGIRVYVSNRVAANIPKQSAKAYNSKTTTVGDSNIDEETGNGFSSTEITTTASIELGNSEYDYKEEHLSADQFRLFKSYTLQEFKSLTEGTIVEVDKEVMSDDYISEQLDFLNASMLNYHTSFAKSTTFNSRLIAYGIKETLEISIPCLNAVNYTNKELISEFQAPRPLEYSSQGVEQYFNLTFYLKDNTGKEFTLTAKHPVSIPDYGDLQYVKYGDNIPLLDIETYANVFQYVICPDKRAYKVDVNFDFYSPRDGRIKHASIAHLTLKEHPYLNCSYYYGGMDENLVDICLDYDNDYITGPTSITEEVPNKIYISEVDSPFVFPLDSRHTFQSEIIGVAIASVALSQGQFGQYPLYVFTKDGIWVMETASDGRFLSSKPLSREVCSNVDAITSIDQAIVFVTSKGVMLLQGSQVTELSPYMNGKHYTIEPTAKMIIESQEFFSGYADTLSDSSAFMAFVQKASVAYDYPGKRLIFINPTEDYQYVYKLDTQTWHKLHHPDFKLEQVLNSYPECYVVASTENGSRVIDLSTHLDVSAEQRTEKVILATRPFDLAEPDVFKTIRDVRVRGQFPKGAVKFILLGSNDGINFSVINTLRGKSWKLFRMIILADLDATDRISWIDVGYETRFTNKLR